MSTHKDRPNQGHKQTPDSRDSARKTGEERRRHTSRRTRPRHRQQATTSTKSSRPQPHRAAGRRTVPPAGGRQRHSARGPRVRVGPMHMLPLKGPCNQPAPLTSHMHPVHPRAGRPSTRGRRAGRKRHVATQEIATATPTPLRGPYSPYRVQLINRSADRLTVRGKRS